MQFSLSQSTSEFEWFLLLKCDFEIMCSYWNKQMILLINRTGLLTVRELRGWVGNRSLFYTAIRYEEELSDSSHLYNLDNCKKRYIYLLEIQYNIPRFD